VDECKPLPAATISRAAASARTAFTSPHGRTNHATYVIIARLTDW